MISSINFYRIRVGKYYRGFPPARVARELDTNHFYGLKQVNILSRILKTPRTTRPLHGTRNCMYKPVVLTPSFLMLFYFFSLFSFSLDLSLLFSFFFYKFVENAPRIILKAAFEKVRKSELWQKEAE